MINASPKDPNFPDEYVNIEKEASDIATDDEERVGLGTVTV
jgi:hypothetical protein